MSQIRKRMLSEFASLGAANIITHDPSKAIAKGAAIYSKMEASRPVGGTNSQKIVVKDIATHTYGVNCRRSSDNKAMIYNLLFKGTPFGSDGKIVVKSDTSFNAVDDSQTVVEWVVYESDGKKGIGEDANWMEYGSNENKNGMRVTVHIPPEFLGKARSYFHWVTFSLDVNGILEIIITDKNGNRIGYDKKQI